MTMVLNDKTIVPLVDIGLKYTVLIFCMHYLYLRCVCDRKEWGKTFLLVLISAAEGLSFTLAAGYVTPMNVMIIPVYLIIIHSFLFRADIYTTVVLSLLSFFFIEALFMLVGFWGAFIALFLSDVPEGVTYAYDIDLKERIPVFLFMIGVLLILGLIAANMKRLRNGLMTIVERRAAGFGLLAGAVMVVAIAVVNSLKADEGKEIRLIIIIFIFAFSGFMIFWCKNEIKNEYIRQVGLNRMTLLKKMSEDKDREMLRLREENDALAGLICRDNRLLETFASAWEGNSAKDEFGKAAGELEKLYSGRRQVIERLESRGNCERKTGVRATDDILIYMANTAESCGVGFEVDVGTDVAGMLETAVTKHDFDTILADLTENAIISAKGSDAKTVRVSITEQEGAFALEVSDSGEKFDVNVLRNMGRRRITTHSGEGGSGIGLMTLFSIVRHNKAGLTIEEYPEGSPFTKSVRVTFDLSEKRRIITDRAPELKRELRATGFEIRTAG